VTVVDERSLQIAAFRHRLIAEAIEAEREELGEKLREAAARAHTDPRGHEVRPTVRTLWRWMSAYRRGGLLALCARVRRDKGNLRAFDEKLLERAAELRREKRSRSTATLIDILVRQKRTEPGKLAPSTLNRHLSRLGLSRIALRKLGQKTFRRIETTSPFDLVVGDFHHGPYVRVGQDDQARRALLCCFIDHFSRLVPEGRYYLHEDFAALRFGFRRLVVAFGLPVRLYLDNGPAFHATRFHAACDALGIKLCHSKPYQSEGRGVVERFNRTVKEQFETEARDRDELLTLDELNGYFEAWLAERYHRTVHSETGETPAARFEREAKLRPAPDLDQIDECLRLRERRTVHRKWSTVSIAQLRYRVSPSLRGRRVDVLYDPFDPAYVLIVFDGRVVERAEPQKTGEVPPSPEEPHKPEGKPTDHLALLRADYEIRTRTELAALRLRPATSAPLAELALVDLVVLLEGCRAAALSPQEQSAVSAFWRRLRPLPPEETRASLARLRRRLGERLHLEVYLEALQEQVVRLRTAAAKKPNPQHEGGSPS
jgi:putative transposase